MTAQIGKAFQRLGGKSIEPATVLPAALPLDLCGESIRARLCIFTDHTNTDLALRPDLTLPVALEEVEARRAGSANGETVHQYAARAFRLPTVSDEPLEFLQVGFERFGAEVTPAIDAEVYALVSEVAVDAHVTNGIARFGDLQILPAFIEALPLSKTVKAGLRRAFREAGGVSAFLERASQPQSTFIASLVGLDRIGVEARISAVFAQDGIEHFGNRTMDEVITRLCEQAREAETGTVPSDVHNILEAVLELECSLEKAGHYLRKLAEEASILEQVEEPIVALETRMSLIEQTAPEFLTGATFSPAFGRRFTYYDGFVFEIGEPGERSSRPFGAGGRYDHLLADLSQGAVSATAIGGVVRPDRLERAKAERVIS